MEAKIKSAHNPFTETEMSGVLSLRSILAGVVGELVFFELLHQEVAGSLNTCNAAVVRSLSFRLIRYRGSTHPRALQIGWEHLGELASPFPHLSPPFCRHVGAWRVHLGIGPK